MIRIGIDEYFIKIAQLVAYRAVCTRAQVGCVLINGYNHVIATGYNGPPHGLAHCLDVGCRVNETESGRSSFSCVAIHAEQNALLQCQNVMSITTCYCTKFPCFTCLKLLMNTSCSKIVYLDDYAGSDQYKITWTKSGRERYHEKSHYYLTERE
jgi:dCMP deaminase